MVLLRIVDPDFRSKTLEDYGVAYVFISIIKLAIVFILPSIVALGFVSGNFWNSLIPGAVVVTASTLLLLITVKKYGMQSKHGARRRTDESNAREEEYALESVNDKGHIAKSVDQRSRPTASLNLSVAG